MHFLDDRYWVDGEWVFPFEESNSELDRLEYEAQLKWDYPRAIDIKLIPHLHALLEIAESYFEDTGRHLNVFGDIGELYGAIMYGIRLYKPCAQGADGRLENNHIEIKTISPMSRSDMKYVKRDGIWNYILLVKIDEEFGVRGSLRKRSEFPGRGKEVKIRWDESRVDSRLPS